MAALFLRQLSLLCCPSYHRFPNRSPPNHFILFFYSFDFFFAAIHVGFSDFHVLFPFVFFHRCGMNWASTLGGSFFVDDFVVSHTRRSGEMDGRVRGSGAQGSPERCMVWTEPSGKRRMQWREGTKVPVVYYICKNSLLEQPHFIEVPFSSTEGLYLRDVIKRLVFLRGNQMPAMYSWSCKRSYRNGFVWQDLAEDDLIVPTREKDYILKGSLLLDQSPADGLQKSTNCLVLQKNIGILQKEHSLYSRKVEASSQLYPVTAIKEINPLSLSRLASPHPLGDDWSLPSFQSSMTVIGSSSSEECRAFMPSGAQDSQTEDTGTAKALDPSIRTTIISKNHDLSESNFNEVQQKHVQPSDGMEDTSKTPIPWNAGMDTLISLIRAEVNQLDSFRGTEEKGLSRSKEKIKRTNVLLQLITCRQFL